MSELSTMATGVGAVASNLTAKALNTFADAYDKQVDEWFKDNNNSSDYDKSDYYRFAFSSSGATQQFIQEMQEQGISVVATPFSLNGQYIVEIANQQEDGRTATDVISSFEQNSGIHTSEVKEQERYQGLEYTNKSVGSEIANTVFLNNLDSVGVAIQKVCQFADFVSADSYGVNSNKEYLHSPTNADGEASPYLNAGNSKVATVINNDTVIIDGNIVKDPVLKAEILAQHFERTVVTSVVDSVTNTVNDAVQTAHHNHTVNAAQHSINKTFDEYMRLEKSFSDGTELSPKQQRAYVDSKQFINDFQRDSGITITSGNPLTSEELHKFNQEVLTKAANNGYILTNSSGLFDTNAWNKLTKEDFAKIGISEASQGIIYSINTPTKQIKPTISANSAYIQERLYRQEYAVLSNGLGFFSDAETFKNKPTVLCNWSLGVLDDITNSLNTERIIRETYVSNKFSQLDDADKQFLANNVEGVSFLSAKNANQALFIDGSKMEKHLQKTLAEKKASIGAKDYGEETARRIREHLKKNKISQSEMLDTAVASNVASIVAEQEKISMIDIMARNAALNIRGKDLFTEVGRKDFDKLIEEKKQAIEVAQKSGNKELLKSLNNDLKQMNSIKALIDDNTLQNKITNAYKVSDEESERIKRIKEKLTANAQEKAMLASKNAKMLESLKECELFKGKDYLKGEISHEKLLQMNREFFLKANALNINFITATGKVDLKLMQNLNADQLSKFGINAETRDLLVKINEKGSFGYTGSFSQAMGLVGKGLGFFINKVDGSEGFNDISELVGYVSKGANYTKQAVTNIRKLSKINMDNLAKLKARGKGKAGSNNTLKKTAKKKPVQKKPPKEMTKYQKWRQDHIAKNKERLAKKVKRKQNSPLGKLSKKFNAVKDKLAKSVFGKAAQALSKLLSTLMLYGVIAIFLISAIGTIVIVIITTISSFMETLATITNPANWFAPTVYQDTIAYQLYEDLSTQEQNWVKQQNSLPQTSCDSSSMLTYSYNQLSADEYFDTFDNLILDGYQFYINPFWRDESITLENSRDIFTELYSFDGNFSQELMTNVNVYDMITDPDAYGEENNSGVANAGTPKPQYGIDNGHTSNVKDILAMVDIMYQFDMQGNDDESISALGCSSAQIDTANFFEGLGNTLSSIGGWFGGKSSEEIEAAKENNVVSYKTIQNYAYQLFYASHQEYIYHDVEYYDFKKTIKNADGTDVALTDGTGFNENSSISHAFGVCEGCTTSSFPLAQYLEEERSKYFNTPQPVLNGTFLLGTEVYEGETIREQQHDVALNFQDNYVGSSNECLFNDMPLTDTSLWNYHLFLDNDLKWVYSRLYINVGDVGWWNKIENHECWRGYAGDKNQFVTEGEDESGKVYFLREATSAPMEDVEPPEDKEKEEANAIVGMPKYAKELWEDDYFAGNSLKTGLNDAYHRFYTIATAMSSDEEMSKRISDARAKMAEYYTDIYGRYGEISSLSDEEKVALAKELIDASTVCISIYNGEPIPTEPEITSETEDVSYNGVTESVVDISYLSSSEPLIKDSVSVSYLSYGGGMSCQMPQEIPEDCYSTADLAKKAARLNVMKLLQDDFDEKDSIALPEGLPLPEGETEFVHFIYDTNTVAVYHKFKKEKRPFYNESTGETNVELEYEVTEVEVRTGCKHTGIDGDGDGITDGIKHEPQYKTYYRCTVKAKYLLYTHEINMLIHDCKGHEFVYCGGHVSTHVQGNVWSITNDQLASVSIMEEYEEPTSLAKANDLLDFTAGLPLSEKFRPYSRRLIPKDNMGEDFEEFLTYWKEKKENDDTEYDYALHEDSFAELRGKVISENIDYSTCYKSTTTGGGLTPYEDTYQGTSVSKGLNLLCDGTNWVDENDAAFQNSKVNIKETRYCRDIFDIDCIIKKGKGLFPITDYTEYEGWNADNMTLVVNKVAMNWYDVYSFDIPTEMGLSSYKLTVDDIDMLIEGIKASYGDDVVTEEREEMLRVCLSSVGQGHYSANDSICSNSYLSFLSASRTNIKIKYLDGAEKTKEYRTVGSSMAGNSSTFIRYCWNAVKRMSGTALMMFEPLDIEGDTPVNSDLSNCKPMDLITHSAYNLEEQFDDNGNMYNQLDINLTGYVQPEVLFTNHLNYQGVVYIGKFTDEGLQAMADIVAERVKEDGEELSEFVLKDEDTQKITGIKLATGQVIRSNIPICVDLSMIGAYSGLYLRVNGDASEDITSYMWRYSGYNTNIADSPENGMNMTYYWLFHPDDRTKVRDILAFSEAHS